MDQKTQKITYGAAIIAIFTILLLLNRQTGGLFEEIFLFVFPIPMVAYAAMYGWKSSIPVLVGIAFFSVLFGTVYTIFYAVSEGLIGLVFGTCIYKRTDTTKTLAAVILMSVIMNLLDTLVLAELFGVDIQTQIAEMQEMIVQLFEQLHMAVPQQMLTQNFLLQILVISMAFLGIMQGYVVYMLSLLVLRRLRFQVPKPKSIFLWWPPAWTGNVALILFLLNSFLLLTPQNAPVWQQIFQNVLQIAGICGNLYLVVFGMLAMILYAKVRAPQFRGLAVLLAVLCFVLLPYVEIVLGYLYVSRNLHMKLLE